jgi:hypothetical protein
MMEYHPFIELAQLFFVAFASGAVAERTMDLIND